MNKVKEINKAIDRLKSERERLELEQEKQSKLVANYTSWKQYGYTDKEIAEMIGATLYEVKKHRATLPKWASERVYKVFHNEDFIYMGTKQEIKDYFNWTDTTFYSNRTPSKLNKTWYSIKLEKELKA